jgi:probable rRNA maturation factor
MARSNTGSISFHFMDVSFTLTQRNALKAYLLKLFKREGRAVDTISYIFCSDEYLLRINQDFLNHDTYTDIITFELSPKGAPVQSDIYISIERVRENATSFGTPFKHELHRVIFHGALHLCGYKDKSKQDALEMRTMEELHLNTYLRST